MYNNNKSFIPLSCRTYTELTSGNYNNNTN